VIRRTPLRLALATAATVVALSGCATFTNTDVVATVGDEDIDNDDFEVLADEFFANPIAFGTTPAVEGRADGEQSRFLLGLMVLEQLVDQFLDHQGIDASEIQQTYIDTALAAPPGADLSDEWQHLIAAIDEAPRLQAITMAQVPDIDELRALYAENPVTTGLVCTRHILVETRAEAERVFDELADGADFAALAIERSIDTTAAATGGALRSGDNECIPLQTVLGSFDPGFVAGMLNAREGIPSEPVESSFGWHVILHRPWDEVAESVGRLHQPGDSGVFLFDGFAATAEVEIDARLGTWDSISSAVAPIG